MEPGHMCAGGFALVSGWLLLGGFRDLEGRCVGCIAVGLVWLYISFCLV